jgi:tetratricopeptide (TPR) repeat protein
MQRMLLSRLTLAVAASAVAFLPVLRADEKQDLQKEIQELNQKTGDDEWVRPKAVELLKNKAHLAKLLKEADDLAKTDSKKLKFNTAFTLALAAGQTKDYEVSLRLLKICEKQAYELKKAKWLIDTFEIEYAIYYDSKRYEEAVGLCRKMLDTDWDEQLDRGKSSVREAMIKAMTREGKVADALKMTDELVNKSELGWIFLELKGWVLHESGRDEEAAKAYLDFIDKLEKDEEIKPEDQQRFADRTRYFLSNVYIELDQVDKAAEMLKGLLQRKPDNPTYNNDLGFVWADHDMHLDEAEKMIRKALEEDRKLRKADKDLLPEDDHDNAAYIDSLGWVLYKKKQYAEAKKQLLEAVKDKDGQHIEILDHLADVHMAMGEKADAIAVWKKALDQDTSTKRDLKRRGEIIKKIKAAEGKN